MIASEFEYRHRFWMILLVYVLAYSFYNVDNLPIRDAEKITRQKTFSC